jgi:hypothetical protein
LKIDISQLVLRMFIVFAALAFCAPAFAQCTQPAAKGNKAYGVPVSDRYIHFQVTTPSGEPFVIAVKEGGMAKIGDCKGEFAYAMIPIVKDIDNKTADFAIYRLAQDKGGNESIQELEHITAGFDEPTYTKSEPKLQIKLTKIDPNQSSENAEPKSIELAMGPHKDCCVVCGGDYACGSSV